MASNPERLSREQQSGSINAGDELVRVLIAPQSFKGSASATRVASAIAAGLRKVWPLADLLVAPIADGGSGTVEAMTRATGGVLRHSSVSDPLGSPVTATWGVLGDGQTAIIEMTAASGLSLITAEERNPLVTTTYGTGQLIRHALDAGLPRIIVGIGDSATNDGGAGAAQALGARLIDAVGRDLPQGGAALASLARVDISKLDPRLRSTEILAATDVRNPLCGTEGASVIYGSQKGATSAMVTELDHALAHYAEILQRDLGVDVQNLPGAGAAGGLGAGLVAFCGARLRSAAELIFETIGLREKILAADLVFTGEGRLDSQDLYGKAPFEVARLASGLKKPTIAIVGGTSEDYQVVYPHGLAGVMSIVPRPMTLEEAVARVETLIADATERAARLISVGQRLKVS
ncbi:MAG: glycerate kinase [Chloroflexota bacterium]|nr:MAG: glycerate kinase [Chloroflexota bacterium]